MKGVYELHSELAIDEPAWKDYEHWRLHHKRLRDTIHFPRGHTGRVWTES